LFLPFFGVLLAGQTVKSEDQLKSELSQAIKEHKKDQTLSALLSLKCFYETNKDWRLEAGVLRQVIRFWSKNIPDGAVGQARYSIELGQALDKAGDAAGAEQQLRLGLAVFEQSGPEYAAAVAADRRILAGLLRKQGKTDEADQLKAMLPPVERNPRPTTFPKLLTKVEPTYSDAARKLLVNGSVVVSFVVDESGRPADIQVIEPLGFGLDENAIAAVKQWTFEPATADGIPVRLQAMSEFSFRLL
jgi:TonB family protein